MAITLSTDREIRAALLYKKLKRVHSRPNTLIINELGLAHAKVRVDLAVINGCVHGFEIKSAADTLNRLPNQLKFYKDYLEKLTIVCAETHLRAVQKIAPPWCGIIEAVKGARGAIGFATIRPTKRNPHVKVYRLAHLLWRSEAVELLKRFNVPPDALRKPRKQLYVYLAELLTVEEITVFIRQFMTMRQEWRYPLERA